jgi:DNA-binding IclR family transcriptional regulator
MAERQIEVAGVVYAPLSQRQISEITGLAFKTVNTVMRELRENGYIAYEGKTRGKYSLTTKANDELAKMSSKGVVK